MIKRFLQCMVGIFLLLEPSPSGLVVATPPQGFPAGLVQPRRGTRNRPMAKSGGPPRRLPPERPIDGKIEGTWGSVCPPAKGVKEYLLRSERDNPTVATTPGAELFLRHLGNVFLFVEPSPSCISVATPPRGSTGTRPANSPPPLPTTPPSPPGWNRRPCLLHPRPILCVRLNQSPPPPRSYRTLVGAASRTGRRHREGPRPPRRGRATG